MENRKIIGRKIQSTAYPDQNLSLAEWFAYIGRVNRGVENSPKLPTKVTIKHKTVIPTIKFNECLN